MKRFNMDGSGELVPKKNGGWVQVNEFKRELKERTSELEQALKDSEGEVGKWKGFAQEDFRIRVEATTRAETAEAERDNLKAMLGDLGIVADGDQPHTCPDCDTLRTQMADNHARAEGIIRAREIRIAELQDDTCPNCTKYRDVIDEVEVFYQSYQGALPTLGDIIAKAGERKPCAGCVELKVGIAKRDVVFDLIETWASLPTKEVSKEEWADLQKILTRRPASTTEGRS